LTDVLPEPLGLLNEVSQAVSQLRRTLEQLELPGLEPAVRASQMALEKMQSYPGGLEGLRQAIAGLEATHRESALNLLNQARLDHDVNGGLLQAALKRNAALQAYAAQASASATYSSEGGVPMAGSGTLIGKY